jgi:hypothetical protein
MGFWSDSSPIVKGAIVVGVIGVIVALMALMGIGPFATDRDSEETTQERGVGGG